MNIQNFIKLIFVLIPALLLPGCSSSTKSNLLPENLTYQSTDYLIGPGDQLQIFVWRNPDLTSNVVVRPDGRISSPLIDDLVVSGFSASVVADEIEKVLSEYIRTPNVSVIVSGFNGAVNQQIRVIGNATNPMVLPYRQGMTLLDVMIAVQGLTDFADGDNAQLIRLEDGKSKQYTVQLNSLIRGGDVSKNRSVYPGDTIIIPESWF
ncbi:MAG: polysaccharide biosynthesis/export family protein [Gammaproteobacteria bacterium]|nr:polysaccharide biosynthesis/export family protein [Gammaproteobacteria bacterium]